MIETIEDLDINSQIVKNMSLSAYEYLENIRKEKEILEQIRLEIIEKINSVIASVNMEFSCYEVGSALFNDILEKKKIILKNNNNLKNYSRNLLQESMIFRHNTEEYLNLINRIENTKVYLTDILSEVKDQAPFDLILNSQETIPLLNIPFKITQFDEFSRENLPVSPFHKVQIEKNLIKNEFESSDKQECRESQDHKLSQSINIPETLPKAIQDAFLISHSSPRIIKNKKLSKIIRKKYLAGGHKDLLFNSKYEDIWESIPRGMYKCFAEEIRNFANNNNYARFKKRTVELEKFLKNFIRVKYTLITGVDYTSPEGGLFTHKIRQSFTKRWVKIKFVLNIDDPSRFHRSLNKLKKMFVYSFYKRFGQNTFKFYGEVKSFFRLSNYSFWNEASKSKYDYLYMKCYQHEEDLMKHFNYDSGFRHNLESPYVEEMKKRVNELEEIRKEYARMVLNYIVI